MNKQDFLNEVLSSDKCPENFETIYSKFQKYQDLADRTLVEFHRVCEKHKIHYQVAFGSLLGAIRDGGQIPWDYDVDVMVPYEEKDRLLAALSEDLNKDYYYYCPESHPKCRHVLMRIAPVGYRTEVLHVDVYFFVGLPNENTQEFRDKLVSISNKRYEKLVKLCDEQRNWKTTIIKLLNKLKLMNYNAEEAYDEYDAMCRKFPMMNSKHCISADICANEFTFKTDTLLKTDLLTVNFGEIRVTSNYEAVLQEIYGDYKKIFPLEDRLKEMMSNFEFLERFAKI